MVGVLRQYVGESDCDVKLQNNSAASQQQRFPWTAALARTGGDGSITPQLNPHPSFAPLLQSSVRAQELCSSACNLLATQVSQASAA